MKKGPKTPNGTRTLRRLADLNDQMCYFEFLREEFRKTRDLFGPKVASLFTTDVFSDNPYAQRIHVTVAKLSHFEAETGGVGLGAFVSASYEVVAGYLEDMHDLLRGVLGSSYSGSSGNQVEVVFEGTLTNSRLSPLGSDLIDTLKYFRLRRNHFVHLASTPATGFVKLTASRGIALNALWNTTDLRFDKPLVGGFSDGEAVESLKVLRVSVEQIDAHVAQALDPLSVARFVVEELSVPKRMNSDVRKRLAARLQGQVRLEFGYLVPEADATAVVKNRFG